MFSLANSTDRQSLSMVVCFHIPDIDPCSGCGNTGDNGSGHCGICDPDCPASQHIWVVRILSCLQIDHAAAATLPGLAYQTSHSNVPGSGPHDPGILHETRHRPHAEV